MSVQTQTKTAALLAGEYTVIGHEYGDGFDYYLTVTGPDGRSTDQMVYWTWSKTGHQVAEEAVAGHVGNVAELRRTAPTRGFGGSFIVSVG